MGNEIGKLIERNVTDPNLVAEAVNFTQIPPLIAQENKINDASFTVLSFNIPCGGGTWVDAWKYRVNGIIKLVLHHNFDIIAFQEPHKPETEEIAKSCTEYDYFGRGRTANDKSEYQPIFFKKERFELLEKGFFWLSPTPEVPGSMGWDAACIRHCVWVQLLDKKTSTVFFVFNTHWDHVGPEARNQSGIVLNKMIKEIAKDAPVILAGDFNTTTESPGMKAMELNSISKEPKYEESTGNGVERFGEEYTWTGWHKAEKLPLDYVLYKGFNCIQYGTLAEAFVSGRLLSDHRPVFCRLTPSLQPEVNGEDDEEALLQKAIQLSLIVQ